jgi:DNA-binding CsgD family transcriptional regulator
VKKHTTRRTALVSRGSIRVHPKEFVFFDRVSGKLCFSVKAAPDGSLPVDETSSLLAMHCLLRSQTPADYRIMVTVGRKLMDCVVPRTKKLIASCSPVLTPIQITARQQQVLRGIFQNLRNKEIAASMHITETTVKFHVSGLLHKFNVADRARLIQKVGELMVPGRGSQDALQTNSLERPLQAALAEGETMRPALVRIAVGERRAGR